MRNCETDVRDRHSGGVKDTTIDPERKKRITKRSDQEEESRQ